MKHLFFWGGVLLTAAVASTACNEEKATGYSGTNKIYLTAENNNAVIVESDNTPLKVEVTLTSTVETATTLTFRLENDTQELLHLEGNPVTIAAGEKSASFQVVSNEKLLLKESTYITLGIDAAQLPANMELAEALRIRVDPSPAITDLTEEQKALIEGYKEKYGFDLNDFLGVMQCQTQLNIPGGGTTNEFSTPEIRNLTGLTVITLSEESTADTPVLKMTYNPMGLTEYLYWVLRQNTVDDDETWTQMGEESANQRLMDRIGWTATSEETFNVTLDGIKCQNITDSGADLDILGEVENSLGDPMIAVPFEFSFSAWNRQKERLEKGDADMQEIYDMGGYANPTFYLIAYGCSQADAEDCGFSEWHESKGHIDFEKGEMTFEFIFAHAYSGDYTIVNVTYTK